MQPTLELFYNISSSTGRFLSASALTFPKSDYSHYRRLQTVNTSYVNYTSIAFSVNSSSHVPLTIYILNK